MLKYQEYIQQVFDFLKTLTIKNDLFLEESLVNYAATLRIPKERVSPYEVPYLQQIAGIRTPLDSRMLLTVGARQVELTTEYLQRNLSARVGMPIGSRTFENLLEAYPNQTDLIKAMIYPVPEPTEEQLASLPALPIHSEPDEETGITRVLVDGMLDLYTLSRLAHPIDQPPVFYREYEIADDYPWGSTIIQLSSVVDLSLPTSSTTYSYPEGSYAIASNTYIAEIDPGGYGDPTIRLSQGITQPIGPSYPIKTIRFLTRNSYGDAIRQLKRLHVVINSPHLELLSYSTRILEIWEQPSILNTVKEHLLYYRDRWNVREFAVENLYSRVEWIVMWQGLVQTIFAERVRNIRNPAVHTYHVWEYLRSHGMSDFQHILTREQQLFLYNNLRYLLMNKGKAQTLQIVSDKLLEPNGIEIMAKTFVASTENTIYTCTKKPMFISSSVGTDWKPIQFFEPNSETLATILLREEAAGLEPLADDVNIPIIQQRKLETTPETVYKTKLLEFSKIPQYVGYQALFVEYAMSTFLHEWNAGRLQGVVVNFHPSYLNISADLTARDMAYLMSYLAYRLNGVNPADQPLPTTFKCWHATRTKMDLPDEEYIGCSVEKGNQIVEFPLGTDITSLYPGREITGSNIPANTIIISVVTYGDVEVTPKIAISHLAEDTDADVVITVGGIPAISPDQCTESYTWFETLKDIEEGADYSVSPIIDKYENYINLNDEIDGVFLPFMEDRYLDINRARAQPDLGHVYIQIPELFNEIERRFEEFYKLSLAARGQADARAYMAFYNVYTRHAMLKYNFTKAPPAGITTFSDWLESNSPIGALLYAHEESVMNEDATWENLLEQFFKRVIPIWSSRWVGSTKMNENEYRMMTNLVKTFCSYNVAFLQQEEQIYVFWRELAYIGYRSVPEKFELKPVFPIELVCGSQSYTISKESKVAIVAPLTYRFMVTEYENNAAPLTTVSQEPLNTKMDGLLSLSEDVISSDPTVNITD